MALILALNRKICRAYARVREGNFTLDGLLGFDLHGWTVGVIGTGKIGMLVSLDRIWAEADIVTRHAPLDAGNPAPGERGHCLRHEAGCDAREHLARGTQ